MLTSVGRETSGMIEAPAHIVYVDANPIAYVLEGPDDLASALKDLLALFKAKPGIALTSELTLAEVLPKRKILDRQFLELLIWNGIFELCPVTRDILIETADYRRCGWASSGRKRCHA